jgi:ferric-dicitrate binding protein FerR (iron transport regulator)
MNYGNYAASDFIKDEFFQDWVLKPNAENNLVWENWLTENPQQKIEVEKARGLLLSIKFEPQVLADTKVESIWQNIHTHIGDANQIQLVPEKETFKIRRLFTAWYQVAAIFLGLLLAGVGLYRFQQSIKAEVIIATNFGETKKVLLPDRSVVILNGNSSLQYQEDSFQEEGREVKLIGEGYFSVVHTKNNQKFRVNISEKATVEVLGTRFTVTTRPQKKQVVLMEGKVKVAFSLVKASGTPAARKVQVVLTPGDLVELLEAPQRYNRRRVENPELYAAFQQNKIVFKDTPLREVARILEDTYGYKVTFNQPAIGAKRFTGSSPANRIDILLSAIEKSFNIIIMRKGENLTIKQA